MKSRTALPHPTRRIFGVFGWDDFPSAPIYEAQFALRFELGDRCPDGPIRFLRAIDRSRRIVGAAFRGARELTAVASYYDGERPTDRRSARAFKALAAMGFRSRFGRAERLKLNDVEHIEQFGQDLCKYWRSAEFPNDPDQISVLLWASVSREMAVTPKVRPLAAIHIVDFRDGVVANVYDDRGMDIAAVRRELIQPVYDEFGEWFLDCDREKMDQTFSRER